MEGELQNVKDNATHQKKRLTDMMMTLLKDLGEIGTAVATQHSELMVGDVQRDVITSVTSLPQ